MLESAKEQIIELIRQTTKTEINTDELRIPPDQKMGDLSFACFGLAKILGKNQIEVAKELAEGISRELKVTGDQRQVINKVEAVGPYLNFFINQSLVVRNILEDIRQQKKKYGESKLGQGKKIMIEYSQPNTHKEFHIGHLRNACLGSALVNLYRSNGYQVVAANYIGDVGSHVAKVLWYLLKFKNKKFFLGRSYAEAVKLLSEYPLYQSEVALMERKLEAGDKKLKALWKITVKQSLTEFKNIYRELGIKFDVWFYESREEEAGKKLIPDLIKRGIARRSEGAVIADLKNYGLDVLVLLRADGTALYATKDLPLAIKKFKRYRIAESYYVIDTRQTLYLKQIFKILELMGFKERLVHIPYEFVTLPEGPMASRYGRVITYANLRSEAIKRSVEETKKRHPDWSAKKIEKTAKQIALAAMKFEMLKRENKEVIVFRLDEALQFEGFTGPYLLYTVARINSIFKRQETRDKRRETRDEEQKGVDFSLLKESTEVALIKKLGEFSEVIAGVVKTNEPVRLARYLFELAQGFNTFYHDLPVLRAEPRLRILRFYLIDSVRLVLEKGLDLLGIKSLKEM